LRELGASFACLVQEEGRTPPSRHRSLRFSRNLRDDGSPPGPDDVSPRRALLWLLFGAVVIAGLVMYFKYERLVVPLLT
jgi:hypothetical protein